MDQNYKLVNFDVYCPSCKNADKSEEDSPCDECLQIPARANSHKPEYWVESVESSLEDI